jgi:hypothetical protein
MNKSELQQRLKDTGRYAGLVDGAYGPMTKSAVLLALTDGPDTKLAEADFVASAERLKTSLAKVKAVKEVESSGAGFTGDRAIILFEGHRFSRATQHRFDATAPSISYPKWDKAKYPGSQQGRYDQLVKAVGLDVDAGFASASYGLFQILGENYVAAGYENPFEFAVAQAYDEATQLLAFENFLKSTGLDAKLRACSTNPADCEPFCAGYNGSAFRSNNYHVKLANRIKANGG